MPLPLRRPRRDRRDPRGAPSRRGLRRRRGGARLTVEAAQRGRVLAVDYGERRVGLALSDPTGTIATPLPVLTRRRGQRAPVAPITELARRHGAVALVVGLPRGLDGTENAWTREVRRFGERLARRTGLPLHWVDERLTSVEAERAVRASGLPKAKREEKERVDTAAAMLILQRFLDGWGEP